MQICKPLLFGSAFLAAAWLAPGHQTSVATVQAAQSSAYVQEDARYLRAGNERVELVFQKSDGRLYSIFDKAIGVDYLSKKDAYWGPFFFQVNATGTDEYISGAQAGRFAFETSTSSNGSFLSLIWERFHSGRPSPLDIRVRMTIHIPASDGFTYWRIAVTNNEDLVIRLVGFPVLQGIPQLSRNGINDQLTHPAMSGVLFEDPVNNFKLNSGWGWAMNYPSAFATMQFMTYASRELKAGLYLAAQDANGHSKVFNAGKPAPDWMNMNILHVPPYVSKAVSGTASSVGTYNPNRRWFLSSEFPFHSSSGRKR